MKKEEKTNVMRVLEAKKIAKVEFNMDGSCQNSWGLSTPAYFAFDDVAVQF